MPRDLNRINPEKLLRSKWTATQPRNREKHFMVTALVRDDDETIIGCELEAVISRRSTMIDWHELMDAGRWQFGWK
jgi:tryptophan-rich hypothetical protein